MNSVVLGLLGLGAMLVLVAIRIPIAFCMALVGFVGMYIAVGWPESKPEPRTRYRKECVHTEKW